MVSTLGLDPILRPRSIAVIGASRSSGTIGHQILANLIRHEFAGPVYPVNPNAHSISSIRAYPTVGDIPETVDLAVIAVPKEVVLSVLEQCGQKGIRGVVVISAGFREMGKEGVEREETLLDTARRFGIRLVGPNCLGVLNTSRSVSMNATFAPTMPPAGSLAFVSQSGAMGLCVLDSAKEYRLGIGQFVSIGNRADVSNNDLLEYWSEDPSVSAIVMYLESFGNPQRFLHLANRAVRRKPVVVMASGRSKGGARAAASHTGALAGNRHAIDALLTQAGVLRAETVEELLDLALALGSGCKPRSRRTVVLTNSGGPGILAADAIDAEGLELAALDPTTTAKLRKLLPAEASLNNPVDMIASAAPSSYRAALDTLLDDPNVDSALAIFVPPIAPRQVDVAAAIAEVGPEHLDKPLLAVLMGHTDIGQARSELRQVGIPTYLYPESAARALGAMVRWRERSELAWEPGETLPVRRDRADRVIEVARKSGRTMLVGSAPLELLEAYGIATAPGGLAKGAEAAVELAGSLGYPVVIKVVAPQIAHKTEIGGVRTDLRDAEEVRRAVIEIGKNAKAAAPEAAIDGYLVQKMITKGRELIVGFVRDAEFGPLVMFGLGGVTAEALGDVVFRIAPLGRRDAAAMVRGIRGHKLLGAFRGRPPVDLRAVEDILLRVSQLAIDLDPIQELDLNPILASDEGAIVADARVVLSP